VRSVNHRIGAQQGPAGQGRLAAACDLMAGWTDHC
jgi:hypothetical protein